MTREEAAAKAICEWDNQYKWGSLGDESPMKALYEDAATLTLESADAHDAANGVHRVSLDDATVERAARALYVYNNPVGNWHNHTDRVKRSYRDAARAVLAAAVKEDGDE